MEYSVVKNCITIKDSYKISKTEFDEKIKYLRSNYISDVFKRSNFSLKMEWAVHNLLYNLGIFKKRTKDVDMEYPLSWCLKIGYTIFGLISWLFIK